MKINHKKIFLLLAMVLVSCLMFNYVEAAITINNKGGVGTSESLGSNIFNTVMNGLSFIVGMAASGIFATITALINVLTVAMFLVLGMIFATATGDWTHIPLPDTIVFNKFAFFDANFINPANRSIVKGLGNILPDLFASFHAIAIAVFIVAAMIAGLRMALSTIASTKAQYKEAALKFVTGFIILICLRWLLAGVFYINETIVSKLYSISQSSGMKIPVYVTEIVPIFGELLTNIIKGLGELFFDDSTALGIDIPGLLGVLANNISKSVGGDIIASIVGFVLMGQSITIVGSYLKRLFMCLLLGIVSPLIVAVDTISAVTSKQSTIFKSWLKNFTTTVFMQSFHAMYMVVVLQVLKNLYGEYTVDFWQGSVLNETQVSIVTIALLTGLVKMEKLIKGMFGIGDSMAGDLKDGGKSMAKAMKAAAGLGAAAKALGDNVPKARDAAKRKQAYGSQLNQLKGSMSHDNAKTAFEAAKKAKSEGNMDEYYKQRQIAAEHMKAAKEHGVTIDPKKGFGITADSSNVANDTRNNNGGAKGDYLQQVINNQSNAMPLTREQQIQQLEQGYAQAHADLKSATLATIMGPANLAAGIGMGLGMGDEMSETLMKGGFITAGLDKATEVTGRLAADKDRRTFAEHERQEGERHGYTPSDKIVREKTVVEKTIEKVVPRDENGKVGDVKQVVTQSIAINPVVAAKEMGKQFSGIGEILSDTMKKELKHIDRDLDNQ